MKRILLATLLTTTSLTPVLAEEITASTRIDAVTVFPSGAEITRTTRINVLKGEHTLILKDLPADVDPQSIRVSGNAGGSLEIRSIDSNLSYLTTENAILYNGLTSVRISPEKTSTTDHCARCTGSPSISDGSCFFDTQTDS